MAAPMAARGARRLAQNDPGLRVLQLPRNCGKGAAVLHGARMALAAGYTHILTMDSDGQHPADYIQRFMTASTGAEPAALSWATRSSIAAPRHCACRVARFRNCLANVETLWAGHP